MGGREARKLVEEYGIKGSKFHPTVQGFEPTDRMAWPIYEVIAEHKLPAIFHSGHSGIGSGMRRGGGLRLQNSNPMLLEDVAIAFPDMAEGLRRGRLQGRSATPDPERKREAPAQARLITQPRWRSSGLTR